MSCYFLAQLKINDTNEYQKYLDGFDAVFEKYEGQVIAVEEDPMILEGDWQGSRVVLIQFSDENEAKRWYNSSEYQAILAHRLRSSTGTALLFNDRES
jgi:uncharacterized protein (DUF1330 family)